MRKKDIQGYEGLYYVTDTGEIWRRSKNKLYCRKLKNHLKKTGYLYVTLCKDGIKKYFRVHRIVATAFLKMNSGKNQVNHINGIKADNRVKNLEWCTPLENTRHAIDGGFFQYRARKGLVKKKFLTVSDILDIREMLRNGEKQSVIANKYHTSQPHISQINTRKKHVHIK